MLKIAIVYDWIDKWGGVERVLLNLHEMFPQAVFFTSYLDLDEAPWARNLRIETSFLQKLPNFIKKSRIMSLFLFPFAFESFNFRDYDLVISVTSSFAKSVITSPQTPHICYILTPTRYFYFPEIYLQGVNKLGYIFLSKLKEWDYIASRRPDYYLSISQTVKKRVKKYYRLDSEVIYPPFDLNYWEKIEGKSSKPEVEFPTKFYLVVSRLEPYKRVEMVIEAFNQNGESLVLIGKGTQLARLKNLAKNNIHFLSDVPEEQLAWFYKQAEALIMPQEEEFGYVALEAQFFDCPVIAFAKGGATETVVDGKTGIFFEKQTPKALIAAVERFKSIEYNLRKDLKKAAKESIRRFNRELFEQKFRDFIQSKINI